jgi:hydroxymethylglutaryl-CoA lyase
MLAEAEAAAAVAREGGLTVSITFAVAFGCPFEGRIPQSHLAEAIRAVSDWDIDEVAFADTIGVGVPRQVREIAELARPHLDDKRLRFHFHNTRNTGYANALEAANLANLGEVVLDAAVGGFGGCPFAPRATGNIGTEDLYYALDASDIEATKLNPGSLFETAEWLSKHLGKPYQSLLPKAGWFPPEA